ncbi:MAG: hypothetical protein J6A27_05625 [Bacteroidales bacterium]|nr:hypothetical protein [Bacteroidales bacterium]
MKRFIRYIFLSGIMAFALCSNAFGQNVIENEEANLKEFDLYSFKDAGTKIKDSSVLYMHLVGVKWGYAMSSVGFQHTNIHKGIKSPMNAGVYYTYLHSLLGTMPYFGIQTGLATTQVGYVHVTEVEGDANIEEEQIYSAVELPLLSIFRVDLKRVRLMLGVGGYLSYIYDTDLPDGIPSTTKKGSFGLMGQGGLAIKLHPFELHLEASYKYGLTPFLDHEFYSEDQWIYSHSTQLQISAGLHYVVGRKFYNKKKGNK